MHCDYHAAGRCASCALIGVPYADQVRSLDLKVRTALDGLVAHETWAEPVTGPTSGFRNKAKLVVGGTRQEPTFGILDGDRRGVDLRHCGLYEPGLSDAVGRLAGAVAVIGLTPYDVPARVGELKHLIVTMAPSGELMARFVLRSPGQLEKVRRALPMLERELPALRVVSVNLQPEHKAIIEGTDEIVLTDLDDLPVEVADVRLRLRPGSFFQTNTTVADRLYRQAASWVADTQARTLWDLYCGVGGFGLAAAVTAPGPLAVTGVEVSPEAIASAQTSAADLGCGSFDYVIGDAETLLADREAPDLVVVNPPRRGIGTLAATLNEAGPQHVIYSSCNVDSLARDLAAMPNYVAETARLFDMFPQTHHHEVLVRLTRR